MGIRIQIFCLLFLFIANACGEQSASSEEKTSSSQPTEGYITLADGNKVFYRQQGTGTTSLVFVHGWCIDGSYFQSQMDHLDDQYRVIAIDLVGHGKSDAKRTDWSMEQFGDDVVTVVQQLALDNVILIGHSMSEVIVAEAATKLGKKVIAIIGVDTYINPIEQVKQADSLGMIGAMSQDFGGTLQAWMGSYFPPETDSAIKNFILRDMSKGPQDICVSIMVDIIRYQNEGKFPRLLASLPQPIRTVNVIPPDSAAWAGIDADFDWTPLQNTGHYPMLEIPAQFNQALDNTLKSLIFN